MVIYSLDTLKKSSKKKEKRIKKEIVARLQEATIILIIFRGILMFYQIFFSPQMSWCPIITFKHRIY